MKIKFTFGTYEMRNINTIGMKKLVNLVNDLKKFDSSKASGSKTLKIMENLIRRLFKKGKKLFKEFDKHVLDYSENTQIFAEALKKYFSQDTFFRNRPSKSDKKRNSTASGTKRIKSEIYDSGEQTFTQKKEKIYVPTN